MKILTISYSDIVGGAARAAFRIHHAIRNNGIESTMVVKKKASDDDSVVEAGNNFPRFVGRVKSKLSMLPKRLFTSTNSGFHSGAFMPSGFRLWLEQQDFDVLHLHWICGDLLTIRDIGSLKQPVIWTIHDMWPFCGGEHYVQHKRWRDGYSTANRPANERGIDLNRWTWLRKKKHWMHKENVHLVAPSGWMADCVKSSALMANWPIDIIPYPIDLETWAPMDRVHARDKLSLPLDKKLVLFGAASGEQDPRKGFDLLLNALNHLGTRADDIALATFGPSHIGSSVFEGKQVFRFGDLKDDHELRTLYCSADVFVLPSRQDNLPNTGLEALACGTPIVAFDATGLPDIVTHKRTGYLATAFESEDLSAGILWVLDNNEDGALSHYARETANARYNPAKIADSYRRIYETTIGRYSNTSV